MKLKNLLIIGTVLLTSACAEKTGMVELQPDIMNTPIRIYDQKSAKISVTDSRDKGHIIEVLNIDRPSTTIDSSAALSKVLNNQFRYQLSSQGLNVNEQSDLKVIFDVERARTYVNQDVLDYRANTIIKLQVKLENSAQTMSKTFTLRATSRGPLSANLETLQKDFNTQLSKLIGQVLEDEQLQTFIKS
ncbi:YajG family lipoprotein [Thalassotalea mangrovi]|uniref:Lipoprotein n=1 Tax=Thalassotalea mangrovi TaxID=2572245 RepID=A0A4U1B3U3_9GAMM|nr:YajG family lipoprotein [Thalassotalea mangrovi]TKB44630.1 hypothetical protein E8M12_10825 [Thalassotalea mangrovi]